MSFDGFESRIVNVYIGTYSIPPDELIIPIIITSLIWSRLALFCTFPYSAKISRFSGAPETFILDILPKYSDNARNCSALSEYFGKTADEPAFESAFESAAETPDESSVETPDESSVETPDESSVENPDESSVKFAFESADEPSVKFAFESADEPSVKSAAETVVEPSVKSAVGTAFEPAVENSFEFVVNEILEPIFDKY